jgi:hypothetical protein
LHFGDQIEAGREKFIQKLLHEIDNTIFERDKAEVKHQRLKAEVSSRWYEVLREMKRVTQAKETVSLRIQEMQLNHSQSVDRCQKGVPVRESQIANAGRVLAKSSMLLKSLSVDLSEVRSQVSLLPIQSPRTLGSETQGIRALAARRLSEQKDVIERKPLRQLSVKQAAIAASKSKCVVLCESIHSLAIS